MTDPTPPLSGLSPVSGKTVITKFDGGLLSSDGGVMALREVEQRLRVARTPVLAMARMRPWRACLRLSTRANCHYRARGNAGGASGLPAAQFPMAHHGAMTAINAELAALALMAEWAAFLTAR